MPTRKRAPARQEISAPGIPIITAGRIRADQQRIPIRRVSVSLDEATLEGAAAIGEGNVSEGIRRAVAASNEKKSIVDEAEARVPRNTPCTKVKIYG